MSALSRRELSPGAPGCTMGAATVRRHTTNSDSVIDKMKGVTGMDRCLPEDQPRIYQIRSQDAVARQSATLSGLLHIIG